MVCYSFTEWKSPLYAEARSGQEDEPPRPRGPSEFTRHVFTETEAVSFTPWPHQTPSSSLRLLLRPQLPLAASSPPFLAFPASPYLTIKTQSRSCLLPNLSFFAVNALEYNLLI